MIFKPGRSGSDVEWNDAVAAVHAMADALNAPLVVAHRRKRYAVGNSFLGPDTTSMLPMLHNRCLWVEDHGARFEDLQVGDVVCRRDPDGTGVVHVIERWGRGRRKGQCRMQGINRRSRDRNWLTPENFQWRMVAVIFTKVSKA